MKRERSKINYNVITHGGKIVGKTFTYRQAMAIWHRHTGARIVPA